MDLAGHFVGNDGGIYRWEEFPAHEFGTTDFSHLPPHDQPPKWVCRVLRLGQTIHSDRSETRPHIPMPYHGRKITEIHNIHSGKVVILFNGPSLAGHDLHKITLPTIGMNRTFVGHKTYRGPNTDYMCVMDNVWLKYDQIKNHPGLINGTTDKGPYGVRPPKSARMRPFSFDLYRDGFVPSVTGHMALQIAVWMGFTEIYCMGLDFGGGHYDGTPSGGKMDAHKKDTLASMPLLEEHGIKLWSCGKKGGIFPYAPFSEVTDAKESRTEAVSA